MLKLKYLYSELLE